MRGLWCYWTKTHGTVLKLSRVDNYHPWAFSPTSQRPFKLGAIIDDKGELALSTLRDLGSIQAIMDFNRAFDQDTRVLGFLGEMDFMLLEQPYFKAKRGKDGDLLDPEQSELEKWMEGRGWKFFKRHATEIEEGYINEDLRMVVMDAHTGNFIDTIDQGIVPIDLAPRQLTEEETERFLAKYIP